MGRLTGDEPRGNFSRSNKIPFSLIKSAFANESAALPWRSLIAATLIFAAGVIGIILIATFNPRALSFARNIPGGDFTAHAILIGTLTFLFNLTLQGKRLSIPPIGRVPLLLGSAIMLVVMTGEECSQMFIASRTFSVLDLAGNYLGIAAADLAARWVTGRHRRRTGQLGPSCGLF